MEEIARCVRHIAARRIKGDLVVAVTVCTNRFLSNDAQGAVCAAELSLRVVVYYQSAECAAAALDCAVSFKHDRAAHRAAACVHRAVFQVEGAAVDCRAVGDRAAGHGECAVVADVHSAAIAGRTCNDTICDTAAIHDEFAVEHVHSATGEVGLAANDAATVHDKRAIPGRHSAANTGSRATNDIADVHGNCATRAGNYSAAAVAAAGDDAAGDGLIAVFIQFPQAVVVRELVVFSGVAVDDGQLV